MERHELSELHYITPIDNVPSIRHHGILSHSRAAKLQHLSVAMQEVQDRRARVTVPGGRPLHDYANLYVCARNPMLYLRRCEPVCVLAISTDVLDILGTVITDSNAASAYVRFAATPDGLSLIDRDRAFAEYWTDPDPKEQWRKKAAKCAEVLVPDQVPSCFIRGAYVSCAQAKASLEALNTGLQVTVNQDLFFM